MASIVSIQNALSAGELSPSLFGRTDLEKWHNGASTCRNFFSNYRGGVISRAGLAYVGTCLQPGTSSNPPRDIPFQFSVNQGYVLEFGDQYMRIKSSGAYVTESNKTISGITQANPASLTITGHGYSVGDWVFISGVLGITEFNGLTWIVHTVPDANHITLTDLFGNVIDSTSFPAYISGGTSARIYTVVAPYAAVDLPYLKYTQSADTMTLCCVNPMTLTEYPPYSLVRHAQTNWTFTQDSFGTLLAAPTNLTAVAQSSDTLSTYYSYVVTAVSSRTGEESNPSDPVRIQNNDIAQFAGTNTISWNAVPGADSYNVYKATPSYGVEVASGSLYGFAGIALGTSFSDTNVVPDFTTVPPEHNDPFARGSITDVIPTAAGINYSQDTISYTVHTSTGSGFFGTPVITNGGLSGFVIRNEGSGYVSGDTITFADSGGGVSTGYYDFVPNTPPIDSQTLGFNGVAIKYINKDNSLNQYQIYVQPTVLLAAQELANYLNSSPDVALSGAYYTVSTPGGLGTARVTVTYKLSGTDGNTYTLMADSYGGTVSGPTLTGGGVMGSGASATLSVGPESGTYPSVAAYYQQRRVYAGSLNSPDTYWMTQPGLFNNMDSSIPVTDGDAIVGTPWAQQVNGIQFLVPMPGGLVVLTGKGAWQLNGGSQAAITPSNQDATPQAYNGCNDVVPPVTINYDILYVQAKGSIIRDLAYNFFVNIYTGTDLTVLSNHLFTDYQILQWAYAEEPYKLVWVLRDDGILLCLTYLKEQDVYSWTRHDTDGLFVSVCSVTEPPVDAVYTITKRYVQGGWRYYSERMNNRIWNNVEDSFCVDSGLSLPLNYPNAILTPSSSQEGTGVIFTASSGVFSSGNIGDVIRVDNGKATVTGYTSTTVVTGTITEPLTVTVPNSPNNMPVPSQAGSWSISTPVTQISGLNHLEGLTVSILADGSVSSSQVVTNGTIILPWPASLVVVGLPYLCQLQTLYLDHPEPNTSQNRRKLVSAVGLRVEASRGLELGADQPDASVQQNYVTLPWSDMNEIKERTMFTDAGTAVPLFTGDYYKAVSAAWTPKGQIAIQQVYPLPASVLSVISYWELGDDK